MWWRLKKSTAIGGLAGTFTRDKLAFDHGSHRLHDGYDPAAGALIQSLCGEELLRRERRGRLYLGDRAIPTPFGNRHSNRIRFSGPLPIQPGSCGRKGAWVDDATRAGQL